MFSWVVKVVPQPPEEKPAPPPPTPPPPPAPAPVPTPKTRRSSSTRRKSAPRLIPLPPSGLEKKPASPPEKKVQFQDVKKEDPKSAKQEEENTPKAGMMMWISQGLASALPQPAGSPKLAPAEVKEEPVPVPKVIPVTRRKSKDDQRGGVIGWLVQGLEKVVPQPDGKLNKEETEIEEETEVQDLMDMPDAGPVVVEVESDWEDEPEGNRLFPPRVIEWIKQGIGKVIPQPEIYVTYQQDCGVKNEPPKEVEPPPPEPVEEEIEPEKQPNMVGWIVQGFGRILPQPVPRSIQDNVDDVQNRGKALRAP